MFLPMELTGIYFLFRLCQPQQTDLAQTYPCLHFRTRAYPEYCRQLSSL